MTLHHSPWGPDSGDCDVTPALPGKRLSTKIMLLSTSATRSLLTLAHTLVRKYGDGGVTRGIYIIYKNRYIYIDRCECYEEAQKARNGQEGHEGPTKTHEKLRRPTKAHEGPRRPRKGATNSDELGGPAGVLQKAAANAANVLRTLGLLLNQRGGPDLSRRILPPNLWPANATNAANATN